jgi:hypothetical protein
LERERQARIDAERRATETEQKAQRFEAEAHTSRSGEVENAIRALKSAQEVAKKAYADAMTAGDYSAAADAQANMSETAARLVQFEARKDYLADKAPKPHEGAVREEPRTLSRDEQFEQFASNLSPRSAKWAREHRDVFDNPSTSKKIGAAHNAAIDLEGIEPDSDAYFAYIEQRLGLREVEKREEAPVQKRQATLSAPVNSSPSSSSSRGASSNVTLSPAEREMAWNIFGDDPSVKTRADAERMYAKNKLDLIREDKLRA